MGDIIEKDPRRMSRRSFLMLGASAVGAFGATAKLISIDLPQDAVIFAPFDGDLGAAKNLKNKVLK